MSLECGYCERDLRGPHAEDCKYAKVGAGSTAPTDAEKLERAKNAAYRALEAAEKAWYAYYGLCEVGPERERAAEVYQNVRMVTRS